MLITHSIFHKKIPLPSLMGLILLFISLDIEIFESLLLQLSPLSNKGGHYGCDVLEI